MRGGLIIPGRPHSGRQAISTAYWTGWDAVRLTAYISHNAVIVTNSPYIVLQTIHVSPHATLQAVTIEESSGRIAVCDSSNVYIYDAVAREGGGLQWIHTHTLNVQEQCDHVSLSWATTDEILVGGASLLLFHIKERVQMIWKQRLSSPVVIAHFSPDGSLIASCGQHDRMVKIWRRLSYEAESTRFDVAYLAHPTSVTNIHWRKPWHKEQNLDNLLYTFCADGFVRVWTYADPHSVAVMHQVASIDTKTTIQPRRLSVGSMSKKRFAFIIDSRDFSNATEKAVQNASLPSKDHALEHLIEIANRSPEICIVLDGVGHMSAWGLENAGYKNKLPTEVFNIAHVDDVHISLLQQALRHDHHLQFCVFGGGISDSSISLAVHSFDGTISWHDAEAARLFDTAPCPTRLHNIGGWAGHEEPISGIVQNKNGNRLCSWTSRKIVIFELEEQSGTVRLSEQVACSLDDDVLDVLFVRNDLMILLRGSLRILLDGHQTPRSAQLRRRSKSVKLRRMATQSTLEEHIRVGVVYEDDFTQVWIPRSGATLNADLDVLPIEPAPVDEAGHDFLQALYTSSTDLPWSAVYAASTSKSQVSLLDLVIQHNDNKLTWSTARYAGLFLWLSEPDFLKEQLENVARAEFTKHEDRSPVDCSLFYLALNKKPVLQGLWRVAIGVAERPNTMKLLANNFEDPKWKSTAIKNAYALLSRRRFEYAAAFFLLGGSLKDAAGLCVNQVGDVQLAVAIARVNNQGDGIMRWLLEDVILPKAAEMEDQREKGSLEKWVGLMLKKYEKPKLNGVHQRKRSSVSSIKVNEREQKQQPAATQFSEPSAESLLDNFGF